MTSNVHPLRKQAALLQLRIELDGVMPTVGRVVQVSRIILPWIFLSQKLLRVRGSLKR